MAIDIKGMLADAMLKLCETKSLKCISVSNLMKMTGVSRQTFYNHFRDKQDLIQWIYDNRILGDFLNIKPENDYYKISVDYYRHIAEHHKFLKQACSMSVQNSLVDHMVEYALNYDQKWCQLHYEGEMPENIKLAIKYHAMGTIYMAIDWIMNDMPQKPEEIARQVSLMRQVNFDEYVFGSHNSGKTHTD